MDIVAAEAGTADPQAQGLVQAQGRTPGEQRTGIAVAQDHGREMQMEFIHKARFQQGQGQTSAAFAEHIGAAQFPAQGPEQFGKIRAALRAGS